MDYSFYYENVNNVDLKTGYYLDFAHIVVTLESHILYNEFDIKRPNLGDFGD